MGSAVEVTEATFETEVIKAGVPTLVDFWAVWCGPCKMIAPVVEEIAVEKAGSLKVCKVDVDKNRGIAMKYGIRSIPTLLLFKNGQVIEQIVGAASKANLLNKLDPHLS
jgi:thioredoxin 1